MMAPAPVSGMRSRVVGFPQLAPAGERESGIVVDDGPAFEDLASALVSYGGR